MATEFETEFDRLISGNDNYRKLTRQILRMQRRLQQITTHEAFQLYLDIEQTVNARADLMLTLVTKMALGRKR